ncbi:MAG: ASPIC/UnbV domain-containing protein [Bacteroidales bacterium]|nr:ASPIC/UnbV domain-containing protein [Bacteroidales bacterium]
MGGATMIDRVTITWPDLRSQTISKIEADQTITLRNKDAIEKEGPSRTEPQTLFTVLNDPKPLHFKHQLIKVCILIIQVSPYPPKNRVSPDHRSGSSRHSQGW